MKRVRKYLKHTVRLFIECDGSFFTMAIRTSKTSLLKALDVLLPDDAEEPMATWFSLRDEK